ncbi:MAG: Abi family protein [Bacilli bacterium]|nr:Abi family protein [Bacilli bacterium]
MAVKVFKTIEEQIQILQNKNMIVEDYDLTKDILIRENYFFINGYRHLFLKSPRDKTFIKGTTFRELYAVFNFDRQIRNIIFKNLLIVENNMKSIFSYQLSKKYGYKESDYLKLSNFSTDPEKSRQINDLLKKMKRQIRVNGGQHAATSHYISNYGYIPMWVVVKVLSFGIVSELFIVMKKEDQDAISNIYKVSAQNLVVYMPILANFRNLCAHEDILYNHKTQRVIEDTKYHYALNIPLMDGEYIYGKNDLFALVIILKQLLRYDEFRLFTNELSYEINILAGKLNVIPIGKVLDAMGMPINFKELSNL